MDDINAIKELANYHIHELFEILDITCKSKQDYLNGPCPVHNGDRKDAWSWHLDRGIWKCFSRGCDQEFGADIFGLVQGINKCSFIQAKEFVKRHLNSDLSKVEVKKLRDSKSNREFVNQVKRSKDVKKIYNKSCLDKLKYHNYLESRGYSRNIVEKYNIGVSDCRNKYMSNRIIFPIQNIKGEIIGFTGRTLLDNWEDLGIPKWKHTKGYISGRNLFNIWFAQDSIRETGEAIIVEGPLDVLRLEEAGVHNSVALLGKELHKRHITLLISVSALKLKIALDADEAGRSGGKRAAKMAKSFFDVEIINLPEGSDAGDLSLDEAREVFLCPT